MKAMFGGIFFTSGKEEKTDLLRPKSEFNLKSQSVALKAPERAKSEQKKEQPVPPVSPRKMSQPIEINSFKTKSPKERPIEKRVSYGSFYSWSNEIVDISDEIYIAETQIKTQSELKYSKFLKQTNQEMEGIDQTIKTHLAIFKSLEFLQHLIEWQIEFLRRLYKQKLEERSTYFSANYNVGVNELKKESVLAIEHENMATMKVLYPGSSTIEVNSMLQQYSDQIKRFSEENSLSFKDWTDEKISSYLLSEEEKLILNFKLMQFSYRFIGWQIQFLEKLVQQREEERAAYFSRHYETEVKTLKEQCLLAVGSGDISAMKILYPGSDTVELNLLLQKYKDRIEQYSTENKLSFKNWIDVEINEYLSSEKSKLILVKEKLNSQQKLILDLQLMEFPQSFIEWQIEFLERLLEQELKERPVFYKCYDIEANRLREQYLIVISGKNMSRMKMLYPGSNTTELDLLLQPYRDNIDLFSKENRLCFEKWTDEEIRQCLLSVKIRLLSEEEKLISKLEKSISSKEKLKVSKYKACSCFRESNQKQRLKLEREKELVEEDKQLKVTEAEELDKAILKIFEGVKGKIDLEKYLFHVCKNQYWLCLQYLIKKKVNLQAKEPESGLMAIHCVAGSGWLAGLKYLVEHLKEKAELNAMTEHGETPLRRAVIGLKYEVVEYLVRTHKVDVNLSSKDKKQPSVLHIAASIPADTQNQIGLQTQIVELLLDAKTEPRSKDKNDLTPLAQAMIEGRYKLLGLFMDRGVFLSVQELQLVKSNINQRFGDVQKEIERKCRGKIKDIADIEKIMEKEKDKKQTTSPKRFSQLGEAIRFNNMKVVKFFVDEGELLTSEELQAMNCYAREAKSMEIIKGLKTMYQHCIDNVKMVQEEEKQEEQVTSVSFGSSK